MVGSVRNWAGLEAEVNKRLSDDKAYVDVFREIEDAGMYNGATAKQIAQRFWYEQRKREENNERNDGGERTEQPSKSVFSNEHSKGVVLSSTPNVEDKPVPVSDSIKKGDVVHGVVEGIQPYGAFVALDSGDVALLYFSEIAGCMYGEVDRFLLTGDEIEAKVIARDQKGWKLSVKALGKAIKPKSDYNDDDDSDEQPRLTATVSEVAPQLSSIKSIPNKEQVNDKLLNPEQVSKFMGAIGKHYAMLMQENEELRQKVVVLEDKITRLYNDDHSAAVKLMKLQEVIAKVGLKLE